MHPEVVGYERDQGTAVTEGGGMRYTREQAERALPGLEAAAVRAGELLDGVMESDDTGRIIAAERRLERIEDRLSFVREVAETGTPGRVYERLS